MCEYCDDKNIGNLTEMADEEIQFGDSKGSISLSMYFARYEDGKPLVFTELSSEFDRIKRIEKEIAFCPFCGRKL